MLVCCDRCCHFPLVLNFGSKLLLSFDFINQVHFRYSSKPERAHEPRHSLEALHSAGPLQRLDRGRRRGRRGHGGPDLPRGVLAAPHARAGVCELPWLLRDYGARCILFFFSFFSFFFFSFFFLVYSTQQNSSTWGAPKCPSWSKNTKRRWGRTAWLWSRASGPISSRSNRGWRPSSSTSCITTVVTSAKQTMNQSNQPIMQTQGKNLSLLVIISAASYTLARIF